MIFKVFNLWFAFFIHEIRTGIFFVPGSVTGIKVMPGYRENDVMIWPRVQLKVTPE